jgi:hypothetical protein
VLVTYASLFWELIRTPFLHMELVWGIVPLYTGWLVHEITSPKKSFRTALNTGCGFLWSAAHWLYQVFGARPEKAPPISLDLLLAVNIAVTLAVAVIGLVALWVGFRRRYPRGLSLLGHARFSNYLMIAIFPMQSAYLAWSWDRVAAILLFALPLWVCVDLAFVPVRRNR